MNDYITLSRAVEATQIPSGHAITLEAGTPVSITQSLGGSFTVHAATGGGLFRISAADADALGMESSSPQARAEGPFNEELVWNALREVYDPEIPVNIVDLGLIYDMKADETEGGHKVLVKMTLTAPGCGMGPAIAEDAKSKILCVPGVTEADVRITWEPAWNQSMISEEGKMKLGLI
jgi:probable FeS assembly SUF system protein SufT